MSDAEKLPEGVSIRQFFTEIFEGKVNERSDKIGDMEAVLCFDITGEEASQWALDIKDGTGKVTEGTPDDPRCTFTIDGADWLAVLQGKINPMNAFMSGKLKVKGDMGMAMKLGQIIG